MISWIEVQHSYLVSKQDLLPVQAQVDELQLRQQVLATKSDLTYIQLGINDIRLRSFEGRGIATLSATDLRIYEGLKASTKELENRFTQ